MATMTGGTGGTTATWTPEVWSRVATVTYRSNLVLANLMDRRWEPELGVGKGDLVNIPSFSQNSGAVARSTFGTVAGLSSELIATTEAQVQLVVNKMAIYGYAIPAEARLQATPEYEKHLMEGIGMALSLYLDNQLAADNTNGIDGFSTVVGTDNVDVTDDDLITLMTNMANANAPLEFRNLVVSPATHASMLKVDRLVNQLYKPNIGGVAANKGRGRIGGPVYTFDVWESNNLEAGSAGGKKNGAFQREVIALCVQQEAKIVREMSVVDGILEYVAGYLVFGHKEVKDSFGNELDGK